MNPNSQLSLPTFPWHATLVVILLTVGFLSIGESLAQSGGTFPGEPFNGLQIDYSISGASLGAPVDEEGFTWSRRLDGKLTGGKLVVSGMVRASSGWGATVVVSLSADGAEPVEYTTRKFPEHGLFPDPMAQPFNVSIDIPKGARNASFSIDLTGDYNAGTRSVVVSGNLAGAGGGSGAGADAGTNAGTGPLRKDFPIEWDVIIGPIAGGLLAGGALAGLAAILSGLGSGNKGGESEDEELPDPNRVVRYILNPSTDHLILLPGDSAPLDISVWAITAGGQRQLAGDAGIDLSLREESFEVVPDRGQGMLRCQVRAADAPSVFTDELVVVASGPGAGTVEAKIALGIKPKLQLIVELESFDP
ncbi:MAG: hypothetical protein KDN19_12820 [Verrucomicrobiae bacterium]|nr:hypothetical protein [Verrucomicrobiae bacterium]